MIVSVLLFVLVVILLSAVLLTAVGRVVPNISKDRFGQIGCVCLGLALLGALALMRPIKHYWLGGAEEERFQGEYNEIVENTAKKVDPVSLSTSEPDDGTASGLLVVKIRGSGSGRQAQLSTSGMSRVPDDLRVAPRGQPRFVIVLTELEHQIGQRYGAGAGPIVEYSSSASLFELPARAEIRRAYGPSSRWWSGGPPDTTVADLIREAVCREKALRSAPVRLQIVKGCSPSLLLRLPLPTGFEVQVSDVQTDTVGRTTGFRMTVREPGRESHIVADGSVKDDGFCGGTGTSIVLEPRNPCTAGFYRVSVDGSRVPVLHSTAFLKNQAAFGLSACQPELFGASSPPYWRVGEPIRFDFGGVHHEVICKDVSWDSVGRIKGYSATVTRGCPPGR